MSMLAHREDTDGWRPRHPVVCIIDIVAIITIMSLVAIYRPSPITAILPLIIVAQYAVSCIHHWMPYSDIRSKIDRGMIFALIGATYVPYWGNLLPVDDAAQRLPWVGVTVALGIMLVFWEASDLLIGILWAAFASAGLIISFYELQQWLPEPALSVFWFGSALYGAQQVVYIKKLLNVRPKLFGYREAQHLLLYAATVIGSIVAMKYT